MLAMSVHEVLRRFVFVLGWDGMGDPLFASLSRVSLMVLCLLFLGRGV